MRTLVILAFALATSLSAQTSNTGTVVGAVTDPSGAALVSAAVVLTDSVTGVARNAVTNSAGRYAFVGVPPGKYSASASAKGFDEAVVASVEVEVNKSYNVDFQLTLGQSRQVVEVSTSATAELQTLDSSVGSSLGGD